jgi:CRP-like cAMP-binding protein
MLEESIVAKLLDVGSDCEFDAGHVIIERGQPGSGLYLIQHGTVRVEAPERTVELGPGEVVGERALDADGGVRSARVICVTDVRAVAVDRAAYEAALSG